MKTKVILTIDTEFSIAGAFADPVNNSPVGLPAVFCEKSGKSHGLGFILDTLDEYSLKGTFFVEALNANYFGYELMGQVAQQIASKNQDVQLHLHPCWNYFKNPNWQKLLKTSPPNDDITRRQLDEIEAIITEGINIFDQWGVPRPIAMRTGSLCVNRNTYKALSKTGIQFASNIGVGIYKPEEVDLELYSGSHKIESCFDLPVLTYCDIHLPSKKHLKLLTITGSCWQEIEFLLLSAAKKQLDYVVILTHPSEFVKHQNDQYSDFAINNINRRRLQQLCSFLQNNTEQFSVTTFSELQPSSISLNSPNTLLETPHLFTLKRMIENYANDKIGKL